MAAHLIYILNALENLLVHDWTQHLWLLNNFGNITSDLAIYTLEFFY